ncbi:hypothetical protein ACFLYY_00470 [Patescibacteria group bacterium]
MLDKNNHQFLKNISEKIQETILSEDTPLAIAYICDKNGIKNDEKIEKISYQTTLVLLGVLPIEDFQEALEKEVMINREVSTKITQEIGRFVFLPVKSDLLKLDKELYSLEKSERKTKNLEPEVEKKEIVSSTKKPKGSDSYRELTQ